MEFKIDITEQVQKELKRLDGLFNISIRVFSAEDVIGESAVMTFVALQCPGGVGEFRALEESPDGFRQHLRVDGTSVKVDGKKVPGGYVVTGWA